MLANSCNRITLNNFPLKIKEEMSFLNCYLRHILSFVKLLYFLINLPWQVTINIIAKVVLSAYRLSPVWGSWPVMAARSPGLTRPAACSWATGGGGHGPGPGRARRGSAAPACSPDTRAASPPGPGGCTLAATPGPGRSPRWGEGKENFELYGNV